eukprot:4517731-Ditylum_brightwellii.AAC.2
MELMKVCDAIPRIIAAMSMGRTAKEPSGRKVVLSEEEDIIWMIAQLLATVNATGWNGIDTSYQETLLSLF